MQCPYCNQEHPEGSQFCTRSGKKIIMPQVCAECGNPVDPNWQHCGYCGQKLIQAEGIPNQQEAQSTGFAQAPIPMPELSEIKAGPSQESRTAYAINFLSGTDGKEQNRGAGREYYTVGGKDLNRGAGKAPCLIIAGGIVVLLILAAIVFTAFWRAISTKQAATMTAAAWTTTPSATNTPTVTPMPTRTPAPTDTPAPTPSITPLPLPEGWNGYAVGDFFIALPEQWKSVDIDKEGIQSVLDLLKGFDAKWAQNTATMITADALQDVLKFWAVDTEPAGAGYASVNVIFQSMPFSVISDDLCVQMPPAYEQLGIELLDSKCGLEINNLDVARFTTRLPAGSLAVKQYQYIYVQDRSSWSLTLSVDETEWAKYQPVFEMIAESFKGTE
jgi:hypothetical protein